MELPAGTALGKLQLLEVLDYYDGPRTFTVQSSAGALYLVFWADETPEGDTWLYVPMSEDRLASVRSGSVSLRAALSEPEDGFVCSVDAAKSGRSLLTWLPAADLDPDQLPPEDDFIRQDVPAMPRALASFVNSGERDFHQLVYMSRPRKRALHLDAVADVLKWWKRVFAELVESLGGNGDLVPVGAATGSFLLKLSSTDRSLSDQALQQLGGFLGNESPNNPISHGVSVRSLEGLFHSIKEHGVTLTVYDSASSGRPAVTIEPRLASEQLAPFQVAYGSVLSSEQVPQADDLERLYRLLTLDTAQIVDLPEALNVVPRQVNYYRQAARLLRYLDDDNMLTAAGRQLTSLDPEDRLRSTAIQFEQTECGWAWIHWSGGRSLTDLSSDSAGAFLAEVAPGLSETTSRRRARTLRTWAQTLQPYHYRSRGGRPR